MEMQYKKGISQIAYLYQQEGDRKSRQDAESKKIENDKKIQLLQMALKRYKNLHVLEVNEEEEGGISKFNSCHRFLI
jgi:novel protein kinase C epsilon type